MNLYGFAGGDPVNASDPFGLSPDDTIEVQTHEVAGGKEHASVRATPNDQGRWAGDSRFQRDGTGRLFVTFGAGPKFCSSRGVCLQSALNRSKDAAPHAGSEVIEIGGRDENEVLEALFRADASYNDQRGYAFFPRASGGGYNSNSYVAGLLQTTGLSAPRTSSKRTLPGWNKPLQVARP
jgi:hypothetical protein